MVLESNRRVRCKGFYQKCVNETSGFEPLAATEGGLVEEHASFQRSLCEKIGLHLRADKNKMPFLSTFCIFWS